MLARAASRSRRGWGARGGPAYGVRAFSSRCPEKDLDALGPRLVQGFLRLGHPVRSIESERGIPEACVGVGTGRAEDGEQEDRQTSVHVATLAQARAAGERQGDC